VAIGAHELNSEGRGIIDTVKTVMHPNYDDNTKDNDIALLKLSKKITFGSKVQPICLHEAGLPTPKQVTVSGWGHTSEGGDLGKVLMEVKLPMVSQAKCKQTYNGLTDNMICAGAAQGGLDSCQGDSGGPMAYRDVKNSRWVQIGVVSFGYGCGRVGIPGVYAAVSQYSDWIAKEMSEADGGSDNQAGDEFFDWGDDEFFGHHDTGNFGFEEFGEPNWQEPNWQKPNWQEPNWQGGFAGHDWESSQTFNHWGSSESSSSFNMGYGTRSVDDDQWTEDY